MYGPNWHHRMSGLYRWFADIEPISTPSGSRRR